MRRLFAVVGVLAAITVFAPSSAQAGGGCHSAADTAVDGTTVDLSMMCMNPRVLIAPAGTVTFVNRDEMTHNLFGAGWGVDELSPGESFTREFVVGTHVYACTLHPGMVGAVVVGDSAATPKSASAQIAAATSHRAGADWFPLGLALGAVAGVAASVAARQLRSRRTR